MRLPSSWFRISTVAVTTLLVVAASAMALGADYIMTRYTIDAGGATRGAGGSYELSGTIGQHDAGTVAGGRFELSGGFWFGILPGDGEEDGDIDLYDYRAFKACVDGPGIGPPEDGCGCYDLDHNGRIDLSDVARFQNAFTGSTDF